MTHCTDGKTHDFYTFTTETAARHFNAENGNRYNNIYHSDGWKKWCASRSYGDTAPKNTGYKDKNGTDIFDGNYLIGNNGYGEEVKYLVHWSIYRNNWIGDSKTEIYDISPSRFSQYVKA